MLESSRVVGASNRNHLEDRGSEDAQRRMCAEGEMAEGVPKKEIGGLSDGRTEDGYEESRRG